MPSSSCGPGFAFRFLGMPSRNALLEQRSLDHALERLAILMADHRQLMGSDQGVGKSGGGLALFKDS